jgi:hypothetical protein
MKEVKNNMINWRKQSLIIGSIITALYACIAITSKDQKYEDMREEASRYIAMQEYEPVGNGGALSEMNGKVSLQRRKMYQRIQEIYALKMHSEPLYQVLEEYDIIRDPNLTPEQRYEKKSELSKKYPKGLEQI